MNYWIFQKDILARRNRPVQAKLIEPQEGVPWSPYGPGSFRSPLQPDPYGVDLRLTYRVNPSDPHPDNYFESHGFNLYSERLAALLDTFGVRAERFPARLVDKDGAEQAHLNYYIYHITEGIIDAMDREASGWVEEGRQGVHSLVLKEGDFEQRPIFTCAGVYVDLMREDVRQAIRDAGLTGFRWLDPARYRAGQYGPPPRFEE